VGRLGLALASVLLLVAAFPAPDQGWLAWIALAPLAPACRDLRATRAAALGLLVGGMVAFGLCRWLFEVSGFGARHAFLMIWVFRREGRPCRPTALQGGRGRPARQRASTRHSGIGGCGSR
jgi:hypothetical protein